MCSFAAALDWPLEAVAQAPRRHLNMVIEAKAKLAGKSFSRELDEGERDEKARIQRRMRDLGIVRD